VESLGGGTATQASRDLALRLVMDAQFYLDPVASFNDAAAAVCLADTQLYGGSHAATISAAFAGRGISTGPCAGSDFPYVYLRILHTWAGDLDINVKVGANVNAPVCQSVLLDGPIFFPGPILGYAEILTASDCVNNLPPTTGQPWWLEVRDTVPVDVGTIENFEISLVGGDRCAATDPPVFIPDNNGFVYSKVDCANRVTPPGADADSDGDTIPDATDANDDNDMLADVAETACGSNPLSASSLPERIDTPGDDDGDTFVNEALPAGAQAYDCDGDGYIGTREANVTTSDQDPCGGSGWPSDLFPGTPGGFQYNTLNIQDLGTFIAPVRRFGTSPGDPNFSVRWDLVPGGTIGGTINLQDIAATVTGASGFPPMLGTQKAFGKACPYAP
jgi:hypothetical protein